ncbi:MAG: recombinase family protein [Lachnospiraceae bacterium]|nr:recombinase family protein [Lachnospiraceae bacterium]
MERAGIYARVSVKHYNSKDYTIENQILAAIRYISGNGMECAGIYSDKGFSGMDFNRPGWKRLVKDISAHRLDVVVVKDFSRIGRNYILAGEYIEKIFPEHGIRLVAVSEGYDSGSSYNGAGFAAGLKNIINEWYARESGRKVSIVKQYQKKKGGYTGGAAPYGYCIKTENGLRFLKEDASMEVLKKIRELKGQGYTSTETAEWLNRQRINRPSVYNVTREIYCTGSNYLKWDAGSVRRLWG